MAATPPPLERGEKRGTDIGSRPAGPRNDVTERARRHRTLPRDGHAHTLRSDNSDICAIICSSPLVRNCRGVRGAVTSRKNGASAGGCATQGATPNGPRRATRTVGVLPPLPAPRKAPCIGEARDGSHARASRNSDLPPSMARMSPHKLGGGMSWNVRHEAYEAVACTQSTPSCAHIISAQSNIVACLPSAQSAQPRVAELP